jgi:hypothetical protein
MSSEEFLIWWNNSFRYDRAYRKKYNIAFNSPQHREISQIDVYLEMREDRLYEKHIKLYNEENEGLELYKKTGQWLKESALGDKQFDKLFDDFDVSTLNKKDEK